ncbi:major capsid protein [Klebsiella phage ZCKP3]|nr:major capsid protein [Klebsiella phage ZCKP3]WPJ21671.1 minor capsid protein [Klebsiella phage 515]
MANMQGGQQLGTNQGKGQSAADKLALFLKVFQPSHAASNQLR